MKSIVIKNATLANGSVTDVLIEQGVVQQLGGSLKGDRVIKGDGLMLLAGFVDLHTHLREPGFEASETVLTGSKAAAVGGYTAIHAMANTNPVADNAAVVEQVHRLGVDAGYVEVRPIGAVTQGLEGNQLADLGLMNKSKAGVTVFSDDGKCVSDALVMRRALEYVKSFGGVIAQHAQEPSLTKNSTMNEGAKALKLGLTGWPAVAEAGIIARDVLLAEATGSRLHICHLSTAEAVDVVRWAKKRGINVTAEVTPHHLLLTEDAIGEYNTVYKVNPPLRTNTDVEAVRAAVADGTIDIVATDHAPHAAESKDCEWGEAAFGMTGLETAASVVYTTLVKTGLIDWEKFQCIMSTNPAEIGGIANHGRPIEAGSPANLVLFDPQHEVIVSGNTHSKSQNSPYIGMTLTGKVTHTIYNGRLTVTDGRLVELEGNNA